MQIRVALLGIKHWKEILMAVAVLITMMIMLFGGEDEQEPIYDGGGVATVSPLVLRYQPLVEQYAAKYGVSSYVQVMLAFMMQESGGRVPDVMQSSESLGLQPNTIQDPEQSIDVGIRYFSGIIKSAKGDVKLALQSYNFGGGFIPYALERGGYSKENAVAFSNMMAAKNGWPRYGDVDYVDHVLRYLTGGGGGSSPVNAYGFIKPVNDGEITSSFGYRIDPFTGTVGDFHAGIDFGCNKQALPIYAVKSGTVGRTGWENPSNHKQGYGQRIYVSHSSTEETVYGHLSQILVSPGQKVTQGQIIAKCGNTGSSTGMHLHFEIHEGGKKIDPAPYIK